MSTYVRTETVEAMQWLGYASPNVPGSSRSAEAIVAWVKAHGGEARYEPTSANAQRQGLSAPLQIRTSTGWAYAAPGDAIVMGAWVNIVRPDKYRAFSVVPAAEWAAQGWRSS